MKFKSLYIGFWQPQSTIHLKEFYDSIAFQKSSTLEANELKIWLRKIKPTNITYTVDEINSVTGRFKNGSNFTVLEDGVVFLEKEIKDFQKDYRDLNKFLNEQFYEFWKRLFSHDAAPVSSEAQTGRKTKNPAVLVVQQATKRDLERLFAAFDARVHKQIKIAIGDVWIGERLVVLSMKKVKGMTIEPIVQYLMFARLFEVKMKRLLEAQRRIFTMIQKIRKGRSYKYTELPKIRDTALSLQSQTITYKSQLNKLRKFLAWREEYVPKHIEDKKLQKTILEFFAALKTTESYLLELWNMTQEYATTTIESITLLYRDNERRELRVLQRLFLISTVIAVMSLGTISGAVIKTYSTTGELLSVARSAVWSVESFVFFGTVAAIAFAIVIGIFSLLLILIRKRGPKV